MKCMCTGGDWHCYSYAGKAFEMRQKTGNT